MTVKDLYCGSFFWVVGCSGIVLDRERLGWFDDLEASGFISQVRPKGEILTRRQSCSCSTLSVSLHSTYCVCSTINYAFSSPSERFLTLCRLHVNFFELETQVSTTLGILGRFMLFLHLTLSILAALRRSLKTLWVPSICSRITAILSVEAFNLLHMVSPLHDWMKFSFKPFYQADSTSWATLTKSKPSLCLYSVECCW